ncbi:hypothetical protein like AT5G42090 [Hibiscus trionum]|uniref:Lung seven transmembrane receptor n=1 Tax=Hibiscus trionum TaxID=183268 RepID=A0A9W7JHZ7_HIBTR|nr:hypothetical protein like AT5G42090 [Hibiscus trionum]
MTRRSFLLFLFISFFVAFAFAEIRFTKIQSDDRPVIFIDEFRFTRTGRLELNVSQVTLGNHDLPKLGFFTCREAAWDHVLQQLVEGEVTCALDSNLVKLVSDFGPLNGKQSFDVVFPVNNANRYRLAFANCLDGGRVSMTVRSAMYNLDGKQNRRDYLPPGEANLPRVYFIWSLVYFTLAWIWIYVLYKGRHTVSRIHFLMLVQVILNALNLVSGAEYKSHIKRTGSAHGWDVSFYIFDFFKGFALPVLIVSIGTCWSQLKPYLQHKVNKFLMIVISLQVAANLARVIFVEIPPFVSYRCAWKIGFWMVDIIYYLLMLLLISGSIESLRGAAQTDGNAAVNLKKVTLLRQYYLVVIGYTYITRALVLPLVMGDSYDNRKTWTGVLAEELPTVALYAFTGYIFMPEAHSQYSVIGDEEKDVAAAEMLKLEDGEEIAVNECRNG